MIGGKCVRSGGSVVGWNQQSFLMVEMCSIEWFARLKLSRLGWNPQFSITRYTYASLVPRFMARKIISKNSTDYVNLIMFMSVQNRSHVLGSAHRRENRVFPPISGRRRMIVLSDSCDL